MPFLAGVKEHCTNIDKEYEMRVNIAKNSSAKAEERFKLMNMQLVDCSEEDGRTRVLKTGTHQAHAER